MTDATLDRHRRHTRRVHRAAVLTALMGVAVPGVGLAWLALKILVCWNDRGGDDLSQTCEWAFVAPELSWALMACVFVALVAALHRLGQHSLTDLDDGKRSRSGRALHRTRSAYHGLERRHRRGVKVAAVGAMWCSGVFAGVAAWYLWEVPPLASLLTAVFVGLALHAGGKRAARVRWRLTPG
jgi:hypothetical protein